jgi:hypothetical protein
MPRIAYEINNMRAGSLSIVETAERLSAEYAAAGYSLTLRQLYYRFVADDLFPDDRRWRLVGGKWVRDPNGTKNAEPNYKWLGEIANQARLTGLIDWYHMIDRTRGPMVPPHWDNPASIIDSAARGYQIDKWTTQPRRVEVWVEKDALSEVADRVASRHDAASFACKGYVSQSAMWSAGRRHLRHVLDDQAVTVLHLGDHDPSGLDMTRDIRDRLTTFVEHDYLARRLRALPAYAADGLPMLEVRRIALNMDQIEQYNPPPNPTKLSDSRATSYIEAFGHESWELDALPPDVLDALIDDAVAGIVDRDLFAEREQQEANERNALVAVSDRWPVLQRRWADVLALLDGE